MKIHTRLAKKWFAASIIGIASLQLLLPVDASPQGQQPVRVRIVDAITGYDINPQGIVLIDPVTAEPHFEAASSRGAGSNTLMRKPR